MWRRSTIRTRLTILYAGAFFIAGALLVAVTYFYLQQSLEHRPGSGIPALVQQFAGERGLRGMPVLERLATAISAQAEQDRRETLQSMLTWSLVSLVAIGVAAGGFGWLLAGRALQPLQDVTATARRVADRNLHERIALTGPNDEIKVLADTFDAMLERLDRAFDGQRRFVANASHELRTPLAINRTLIEVALDDPDTQESTRKLGETLLAVNQRQERLIDGLLMLAGSAQRLETNVRVDLAQSAQRALTTSDPAAKQAGITFSTDLNHVDVQGDPVLLDRLAQNLVDNAVRYNVTEHGWVHVHVARVGDVARLVVQNSGPPVSPGDVGALFEPFRRLGHQPVSGGGGTGLGLSIVRSIATAHGGDVQATARPEGGLEVVVSLPARQ
ncbi:MULTISPECIES: HAMP domain-containing sensor histidine kinase [unclassified Mycobacterium]|uniref:sensor histidine kinase n=1 Tax=unclassified Mycobacterium TaxID=2642494 RepID=UPI0029C70223|nr:MULTISPECIES: HAMP domain-containing sensor histidine kinase [unclassified Mycobacterium]